MVGGGLMQLVAYGAQDAYLTGNPQITFFKTVYRRHTDLSLNEFNNNEIEPCQYIYKKYELFKKIDKYNQSSCPICHDEYCLDDDILIWGCQHIYHKNCHHENIRECPICRHSDPYDFSELEHDTDEYKNENTYKPEDLVWEDSFLTEININEEDIMTITI